MGVALREVLRRRRCEVTLAAARPIVLEASLAGLAHHAVAHDVAELELRLHQLIELVLDHARDGPRRHSLAALSRTHHLGLNVLFRGLGLDVCVHRTERIHLVAAARAFAGIIAVAVLMVAMLVALSTLALAGLLSLSALLLALLLALSALPGVFALLLVLLLALLPLALVLLGLAGLGIHVESAALGAASRALHVVLHDLVVDGIRRAAVEALVGEDHSLVGFREFRSAIEVVQEFLERERRAEVAFPELGTTDLGASLRPVVILPDDGVDDVVDGPVPDAGVFAAISATHVVELVVQDLMAHDDHRFEDVDLVEEIGMPEEHFAVGRGSLPALDAFQLGEHHVWLAHGNRVEVWVAAVLRLLEHARHAVIDLLTEFAHERRVFYAL